MTRGRPLPQSLFFFQRKRVLQESCRIPQVHFHCVFSGTMRVGFTSQCEFTCDAASPCRIRENAPRRNDEEVLKLEERDMLTKEFSHVCVAWKKSDAAASTCAKDPQAPKKSTSPREDMWFTFVVGRRVGMNETCYFTFDMQKLGSLAPRTTSRMLIHDGCHATDGCG